MNRRNAFVVFVVAMTCLLASTALAEKPTIVIEDYGAFPDLEPARVVWDKLDKETVFEAVLAKPDDTSTTATTDFATTKMVIPKICQEKPACVNAEMAEKIWLSARVWRAENGRISFTIWRHSSDDPDEKVGPSVMVEIAPGIKRHFPIFSDERHQIFISAT